MQLRHHQRCYQWVFSWKCRSYSQSVSSLYAALLMDNVGHRSLGESLIWMEQADLRRHVEC